jgi:hypothetical protein
MYAWLTKTQAVGYLQGRLSNSQYWGATELWVYLSEALRSWNAITEQWNADFVVTGANGVWINIGNAANSPRLRSVTDITLYDQMCYMLLEAPYTSSWQGTSQFNIAAIQSALQKRTNEVIQATSSNLAQLGPLNATPGTARTILPDAVLQPRRVRFLGVTASTTAAAAQASQTITVQSNLGLASGQLVAGTGIQAGTFVTGVSGTAISISLPTTSALSNTAVTFYQPRTLTREDAFAFDSFEVTSGPGTPLSWAVSTDPPLAFDVDTAPNVPGYYDVLALSAAPQFAPPTASLLGVPDDWSWVPMYGALADVLASEPEAVDRQRSAYCLARYNEGLRMMMQSNWLTNVQINGQTADTPSLAEMDVYAPEWQVSQGNLPAVIQAGMDFVAPVPGNGQSVTLSMVQNAPLLDATSTYVQVSRDDFEAVLNYAHHLSLFKQGGDNFASAMSLIKDFFAAAVKYNERATTYGLYVDQLRTAGERQQQMEPK